MHQKFYNYEEQMLQIKYYKVIRFYKDLKKTEEY